MYIFLNNLLTMDLMEAALAALTLSEKPNITAVAKKYTVDRFTLFRRFNGVTSSKADHIDHTSLLSKQ